jgi:DNA invertase Pin-like site-specific DNA recombinase
MLAVLYLRMSSYQQDMSIEQQRKEVRALSERLGYTIVAEYVDAGLSNKLYCGYGHIGGLRGRLRAHGT